MRLRSILAATAASAAISAGLLVAVPATAQADTVKHINCDNNILHRTGSDLTLTNDYSQLVGVTWNTEKPFHPDKITWAAYVSTSNGLDWVVVAEVGGTSSTVDDVDPSGSIPASHILSLIPQPLEWRMSVWDKAMGNCTGYFSF